MTLSFLSTFRWKTPSAITACAYSSTAIFAPRNPSPLSPLPSSGVLLPMRQPTGVSTIGKSRSILKRSEGIIAIEENNRSLIINSLGMKQFQICQNETAQIALTLFKSTGVLGRDDLDWRPGRASGINNTVVNTPDAQLLKPLHFSLTLALADRADPVDVKAS